VTHDDPLFVAVDLGAGSGRVFLADLAPGAFAVDEVHRFHYPPARHHGHLRWDFARIAQEVRVGLRRAGDRARAAGRRVASIGVDSWGVDYGLVDREGRLLEDPVCYRDERTNGVMPQVFARIPREDLFARTGIQFLQLNTLFQLYAHAAEGFPPDAHHLLLIADLVASTLTGRFVTEFTNATTTQMMSAQSGLWDTALLDRLGLPAARLTGIVVPGETIGPLLPEVAAWTGLTETAVVAVASHDTGSAVAGAALEKGWAFISSGTWSLVGVELGTALIAPEVARLNFTNEGGAFETTRFLKNVMGLWILESCRTEWARAGLELDHARLLAGVASSEAPDRLVFPDDPRFLNPPSMLDALAAQMRETDQPLSTEPARLAKVILDSLALRYASVVASIARLTGPMPHGVRIVGGGSRNAYLNQATATATGLPVSAGPVESTVIGNAIVQAIAAGRFPTLADARAYVAAHTDSHVFTPQISTAWAAAAERYATIVARFLGGSPTQV
jgi:rhamnulokinase